jgi:hypothetical protein
MEFFLLKKQPAKNRCSIDEEVTFQETKSTHTGEAMAECRTQRRTPTKQKKHQATNVTLHTTAISTGEGHMPRSNTRFSKKKNPIFSASTNEMKASPLPNASPILDAKIIRCSSLSLCLFPL